MNNWVIVLCAGILFGCGVRNSEKTAERKIDRHALVQRNNPRVTEFEELASLSVGNGNFAFTVDATGLQTFPESYAAGVPLGTQSQWGWHSFPDPENFQPEEALKAYDFGRGKEEFYSVEFKEEGRKKRATEWLRSNPHRLHLGNIGFELTDKSGEPVTESEIEEIDQELNLWEGIITSSFRVEGETVRVRTAVDPENDRIAVEVESDLLSKARLKFNLRFSYPTGGHSDDASDRTVPEKHQTEIIAGNGENFLLKRTLDETVYFVRLQTSDAADLTEKEAHYFLLSPGKENRFSFVCHFLPEEQNDKELSADQVFEKSAGYWKDFWQSGGAVDFSGAADPRAGELERRVILSQYLMAIQSAGMYPPQETGLTYNSWFGKFHLEMHWWHAVHFALWNRIDLLERSMDWYAEVAPIAREIARRQGFDGLRWMKMTDPSGEEAPSNVGSFLIWQQPHYIYLTELLYRADPSEEILLKYGNLVEETAEFMASFADYEEENDRFILQGIIAAQETLRASETINPPFEVSYWHYGLSVAQKWRERLGKGRHPEWDEIIDKLSPLASKDGLYLASEDALDTYENIRFTSDHPAVLGALGILPENELMEPELMNNTLDWVLEHWNWDKTWGWDYPMTAMTAARLYQPEKAVDALLMDRRTNTYLINGHNYQDGRLRVYLPGNGGLLTAVAMMCAGWDGNKKDTPGFPDSGGWEIQWEDLMPMP